MKQRQNSSSGRISFDNIFLPKNLIDGTSERPKQARKAVFPLSSSASTRIVPVGVPRLSETE
jgi:hypothetical protein